MLTFNLKKQWYEKIRSGEKTIEYREVKPYWTKRLNNEIAERAEGLFLTPFNPQFMVAVVDCSKCPRDCILRLGYTKQYLKAKIVKIEVVNGKDTDLAIDAPVFAIHLADVREVKDDKDNNWLTNPHPRTCVYGG